MRMTDIFPVVVANHNLSCLKKLKCGLCSKQVAAAAVASSFSILIMDLCTGRAIANALHVASINKNR